MSEKEATARIKINKLLEAAGWRFFPNGGAPASICLEPSVALKSNDLDAFGDNFDKPEEYYTLDKLRKAAAVDRRLSLREILEKVFRLIPRFKSKDELLEEEFAKFKAVPAKYRALIPEYVKDYVSLSQFAA